MARGECSHLRHARDGEAVSNILIGCSTPHPPATPFQSAANSMPVSRAQRPCPWQRNRHIPQPARLSRLHPMRPWFPWRIRLFLAAPADLVSNPHILLRTAISCLPSHDDCLTHLPRRDLKPAFDSGLHVRSQPAMPLPIFVDVVLVAPGCVIALHSPCSWADAAQPSPRGPSMCLCVMCSSFLILC